jgi:hypothetical protein
MHKKTNTGSIRCIKTIKAIRHISAHILAFDIEETILKPNMLYETLITRHPNMVQIAHEFHTKLVQLISYAHLNLAHYDAIVAHGKHYKRELIEPDILQLIDEFRQQGKRIYALTSGRDSIDKFLKLYKQHGIVFDHVICTNRGPKGPALLRHVIEEGITDTFVFIDNHKHKLYNVRTTFAGHNLSHQIKLFQYVQHCRSIPTMEQFIEYWTEVIDDFKKQLQLAKSYNGISYSSY